MSKWNKLPLICCATKIAALFHDIGKANKLFQKNLRQRKGKKNPQPYRHEWISLRLFQSLISENTDEEWLKKFCSSLPLSLPTFFRDGIDGNFSQNHPIKNLPPFAQLVAWLIMSHHKLPFYPYTESSPPSMKYIDSWFSSNFDATWNSVLSSDKSLKDDLLNNWSFEERFLYQSKKWQNLLTKTASETLKALDKTHNSSLLHEELFSMQISRLGLMLADHYYSQLESDSPQLQNSEYNLYANTNKINGSLKQKLDEHLIGVSLNASDILEALPKLKQSLKKLGSNTELERTVSESTNTQFIWQNKARDLALELKEKTLTQGFFGLNMASTGTGKTYANAKIMYALGSTENGIRFNVALGLRILTLQTGVEFQNKLKIDDRDLAILVGGNSAQHFFSGENPPEYKNDEDENDFDTGSESENPTFEANTFIKYQGSEQEHNLFTWTKHDKNIDKIIQAPVLVCTIDHLVGATEGTVSGRQIAPTLRLLTSDLVLDEPDDFALEDLPALCRLVHCAAMLGSRVLLSSATIPPSFAFALFDAYRNGWKHFIKSTANIENEKIICAWFDENEASSTEIINLKNFQEIHTLFINKRVSYLNSISSSRKGYIAEIIKNNNTDQLNQLGKMGETIFKNILSLHNAHKISKNNKHISIGLVRIANINPLVGLAKELLTKSPPNDTMLHFCIYHSRYPLAIRSHIEAKLDKILKRHDKDKIWQHPEIEDKISNSDTCNHIFVVLASPVAEVGRDHDYDWAIVEPSSMRSIIQLAGRILRHRNKEVKLPNICLLNENYKALKNSNICFSKPGYESENLNLESHELKNLLSDEYLKITSIARIINIRNDSLAGLEHKATATKLFGVKTDNEKRINGASVWWENKPHWSGEVQRQQRFRQSQNDEAYYLCYNDQFSLPTWKWKNEAIRRSEFSEPLIEIKNIKLNNISTNTGFWFTLDALEIYEELSKKFEVELLEISKRFGEVRLRQNNGTYFYEPNLGVYQEESDE